MHLWQLALHLPYIYKTAYIWMLKFCNPLLKLQHVSWGKCSWFYDGVSVHWRLCCVRNARCAQILPRHTRAHACFIDLRSVLMMCLVLIIVDWHPSENIGLFRSESAQLVPVSRKAFSLTNRWRKNLNPTMAKACYLIFMRPHFAIGGEELNVSEARLIF